MEKRPASRAAQGDESTGDTASSKPSSLQSLMGAYYSLFPVTDAVDKRDLIKLNKALPILVVYHAIVIAIFIASFYTQYQTAVSRKYLTPVSSDPGPYCLTSKNLLNVVYRIDRNGNWEGSAAYDLSNAVYEMAFERASMDTSSYQAAVEYFRADTKRVSDMAEARGHSFLLSALASYTSQYSVGGGNIQFYAIGDADYIYRQSVDGYIFLSRERVCSSSNGEVEYDPGRSSFVYSLELNRTSQKTDDGGSKETAVDPCGNMFHVDELFGSSKFSGYDDPSTIYVEFDIRSIATIIGIHNNITSLRSLKVVNTRYRSTSKLYEKEYVDSYYKGMEPILCFTHRAIDMCVLQFQDLYFMPILTNAGNITSASKYCVYDELLRQCNGFVCQEETLLSQYIGLVTVDIFDTNQMEALANSFAHYSSFQAEVFRLLSFGTVARLYEYYNEDADYFSTNPQPTECNMTINQFLNTTFTNLFSFSGTDINSGAHVMYNQTVAQQLGIEVSATVSNEFAFMFQITDDNYRRHYSYNYSEPSDSTTYYGLVIDSTGVIYPYSPKNGIHNELYVKKAFDVMRNSPPESLLSDTMTCTTSPSSAAVSAIGISISNATQVANLGFVLMLAITIMMVNMNHRKSKEPLLMKVSAKHDLKTIAEVAILEEVIRHAHGVDKERCIALLDGIKRATMLQDGEAISTEADATDYVYEQKARDKMIEMNLYPKAAIGSSAHRNRKKSLFQTAVLPEP